MDILSKDIIEKCMRGDKTSFRFIVESYQRMIFSLAFRMVCDEDLAKDIVQSTFIKVWTNLDRYDSSRNFHTWIYTIATRLCLDHLKTHNKLNPLPEDEYRFSLFASDNEADTELSNAQLASVIKTLVANLSPKQRIVFSLTHLENLSPADVVEISGLDADKVKSNLYLARKTIREQLKRLGYEQI